MPQANTMNLKHCNYVLLGTSVLVCLALATPVMAADFTITSGATTNDGNPLVAGDTVTVTGALTTTGGNIGIDTTGGTSTVSVSEAGSIETTGNNAYGIINGANSETTVSGSITTEGEDSSGIYNYGSGSTTTLTSTGVIIALRLT